MPDGAPVGAFRRYGLFFLISLALAFAPGPDILFVFAQSLAYGWEAGFCVTFGLCTGLCVHVTLAAFGVGLFLQRHPKAFTAVTICGAFYLAYLGWNAWQSACVVSVDGAAPPALPPLRLYLRGIVMNVCNPKVILFFLAFLPRFMRPEEGRLVRQFLLLGGTFMLAALFVFSGVAACGGGLAQFFALWPSGPRIVQCFTAVVLFGLAAWIAWSAVRAGKPNKTDPPESPSPESREKI